MPDYEPEKKELASRDVVSRRMEEHIKKGKGVKSRFGGRCSRSATTSWGSTRRAT